MGKSILNIAACEANHQYIAWYMRSQLPIKSPKWSLKCDIFGGSISTQPIDTESWNSPNPTLYIVWQVRPRPRQIQPDPSARVKHGFYLNPSMMLSRFILSHVKVGQFIYATIPHLWADSVRLSLDRITRISNARFTSFSHATRNVHRAESQSDMQK